MNWKVVREKGIKLKGMTRRVFEAEVVAFLRPIERTVFLLRGSGGVGIAVLEAGTAQDLCIDDENLTCATVACLLEWGLEVFDDLDSARASVEARTESVLDRLRPDLGKP